MKVFSGGGPHGPSPRLIYYKGVIFFFPPIHSYVCLRILCKVPCVMGTPLLAVLFFKATVRCFVALGKMGTGVNN